MHDNTIFSKGGSTCGGNRDRPHRLTNWAVEEVEEAAEEATQAELEHDSDAEGAVEDVPETKESEIVQLKAKVQSNLHSITINWIEIGEILVRVHSNYPAHVFSRFVKDSGLKPNMATKLRALGSDQWFSREDVRDQLKYAERTELYYAHLLEPSQKDDLLQRIQSGKPITRKLIQQVKGGAQSSSQKTLILGSITVQRQFMKNWSSQEFECAAKLIHEIKQLCAVDAPYGVTFNERVEI